VLEGGARALLLMTPGGLERMFLDGGTPVTNAKAARPRDYDLEQVARLAGAYGLDIVGPPLEWPGRCSFASTGGC
jgi:hypothetical protein